MCDPIDMHPSKAIEGDVVVTEVAHRIQVLFGYRTNRRNRASELGASRSM